MSVISRGSRGSGYRKVASTSQVDESLFGERHAVTARKKGTVSRSKVLSLTGRKSLDPTSAAATAPIVVSASELARIKNSSIIKTQADLKREAAQAALEKAERHKRAQERKDRIVALEERRKKAIPLTTLEAEKKEEDAKVLQKAKLLRKEALDDVKSLNSYSQYAKTVTIRKKQMEEKEARLAKEREAERIRDLEMEIERLETVKMYRDREEAQRRGLVEARRHIEIQIAEREKMREAEHQALLEEQKRIKQEAVEAAEKARREQVVVLEKKAKQRAEVLKANAAAIKMKEAERLREIEEDEKIRQYNLAEEEKKRLQEEEEARVLALKELEFAKLRAKQEKMADSAAELDAIRARRAFEAGQREARRKDMEEAKKRKALQDDLIAARIEQQERKEMMIALEIQREREEFERNSEVRSEWLAKEKSAVTAERHRNLRHKDDLISDISKRERDRKAASAALLEESRKGTLGADLDEIRRIRDEKVTELLDAGVDPLYVVELKKYDPQTRINDDFKMGGKVPTIG